MSGSTAASLFDYQPVEAPTADLAGLLDRALAFACDIDHALLLASALGWRLLRADGGGGGYMAMMTGPIGPCLTSRFQHEPAVEQRAYTAVGNHRSLYGAIVLAIFGAVSTAKRFPAEAEYFQQTGKILPSHPPVQERTK